MSDYGLISGQILATVSLSVSGIIIGAEIIGAGFPHAPVLLIGLACLIVLGVTLVIINSIQREDKDT
jgi:hypothetical protein